MGLKKYEIITVGSDKRVRALRSWQVQDRYVNIGDVGGIVYDEKTLSQDGACWLFRGNFGFPGARIGGDSIVDVGETTLSTSGSPNVDILGSSTFVGSPVQFSSDRTTADAVTLTAADFEQGGIAYSKGTNWETWKTTSTYSLRPKTPIFMGGVATTLKLDVPGYKVQAFVTDRDGIGTVATAEVSTGAGVTLTVPAGQYFTMKLIKNPLGVIVPSEATAAQIKFTGTYETKLVMVDSRLERNPVTSTGIIVIRPGGTYTVSSGAKYPDSVIADSKVSIYATSDNVVCFMSEFSNVNATIDAAAFVQVVGLYRNVNNLVFSGSIVGTIDRGAPLIIQAYDCDNMVVNPTNFPGLAAMQTAGVPIKFYNCNLVEGRFYHHARIANTYRDINFDLATKDLGKPTVISRVLLVSSEVNGMYRLFAPDSGNFGALIEDYNSIIKFQPHTLTDSYATTIYADAYVSGEIRLKGTNVFGNSMKHDVSDTQNVLAVQGGLTLTANQPPVPNKSPNAVSTISPIRINGRNGFTVMLPTGIQARLIFIDARGIYVTASGWLINNVVTVPAANLKAYAAFITFQKTGGAAITPDDVKGVTITTYNGCKIVNTKATPAMIAGNVRVEDNATIIDTSVTGTGYFGGNSIIQAPSYLEIQLPIVGAAYMSDNAVFAPSVVNATAGLSLLEMTDNAVFAGRINTASASYDIVMANNAQFFGHLNSPSGFIMRGNSFASAESVVLSAGTSLLIMRDDARVENGSLMAKGHITLCGKYKQTANKVWTGKRVIDSQDAPEYDNNVKTKYDF